MSRDAPPPLPGGYKLGEKVFFTGRSQTFPSGNKLVHGQQGEVVGPATHATLKGKGVAVRSPGNKGSIGCFLTEVRRLRAAPAADPPRACAPHTRDAAHAPSVPATASAATPQPSLHAQPLAPRSPQPGCGRADGRGRDTGYDRFGVAAPERAAAEPYSSLLLTAGGCVRR